MTYIEAMEMVADNKAVFSPTLCGTVARKPLVGTVAANVLAHGTGALNIDGCRVATDETITATRNIALGSSSSGVFGAADTPGVYQQQPGGRWPANLIHDGSDEVASQFPAKAGASAPVKGTEASMASLGNVSGERGRVPGAFHADTGSAARFFYCAKASRADRNKGLEDPGPQFTKGSTLRDAENLLASGDRRGNHHPTVKPTDLMAYLVRLVTPPGGVVLDPFMGSGSTGKAAMREGARFIGCEMSPEYLAIAQARIEHELALVTAANAPPPEPPQPDLFAS